jgi:hypothetical protein
MRKILGSRLFEIRNVAISEITFFGPLRNINVLQQDINYIVSLEICESYVNGRAGKMKNYFPETLWDIQQAKKGEDIVIKLVRPATVPAYEWITILFQLDVSRFKDRFI